MDRFEAMSTLLSVVDHGSLSAAGRAMRVPVATVSRRLADLESLLGTRLLVRTTRRLSLTDAGEEYVAASRIILDRLEEAERKAAGEFMEPRGELVLTAPQFFGRLHVLPLVSEFLGLFPDIAVRLLLSDSNAHLVEDHVDMAVRIGRLPDSGMIATHVGSMRTVICASPALLDGYGVPDRPADLASLPCIMLTMPMPFPAWRMQRAGSSRVEEISVVPRLSVTSTEAAVDAAVGNVGFVRLLHYQVADAVAAGQLRIVLEDHEPSPVPVHLLHAARGRLPLKMRSFLDFSAPRLRSLLSSIGKPPHSSHG